MTIPNNRRTIVGNEESEYGLISDLGSEIESILELSIRGNLKQLLATSIDSSSLSQDFHNRSGL